MTRYEYAWDLYSVFEGVKDLYVERAKLSSLEPFGTMSDLEVLEVIQTTLSDISTIAQHPKLQQVSLSFNFIEDISPLLELDEVFTLDLHGNPLSEESYYEIVPKLEEKGMRPRVDDEEIWRLCCEIHARDTRATYGRDKSWASPRLVVPDLQFEYFEKGVLGRHDDIESRIEPEAMREALDRETFDAAELALEHWDRPYRYADHVEFRPADQTRERADQAGLDTALANALVDLDARLGPHRVAGEDDAVLDRLAGRIYGWRSHSQSERPDLPDWWRTLRRVWAYPVVGEAPWGLRFGEDAPEAVADQAIWLRTPGLGSDGRTALADHRRLYPVAWGSGWQWCLAVRLGDADDRGLYLVERDRVFEWAYDPPEVFSSIEAMFDAVVELADPDENDDPLRETPRWRFEADAHHEHGGKTQALGWIEAAELPPAIAGALSSVVEAFDGVSWVREDAAKLEYWETTHGVRFPAWYRQWRGTLAWARDSYDDPLMWETGEFHGLQMRWDTRQAGVRGDEYHQMIHELEMLPVAQSMYKDLLINLADDQDRRLYLFDREVHRQGEYTPEDNVMYAGPEEFLADVDALVDAEGFRASERG
jgi:hypothetical protein